MKTKQSKYPILYGAYGANTNRRHMATRCPTARYVGNIIVADFALVFRGVADIIPRRGATVQCALWRIMPGDERALDMFEGYPNHYGKMLVDLTYRGRTENVMLYIMAGKRRDRHEPPKSYEDTLREGYADCGMPTAQIDEAVRDARESARRELRYKGKWYQQDRARRDVMGGSAPRDPEARVSWINDLIAEGEREARADFGSHATWDLDKAAL